MTDGLLVADYNLELPLDGDVRGPVPMALDFAANLLSGSYSVTLFLLDKATYDKVVYLDFVKMFNVTENNSIAGLVHVSPQVQCLKAASCAGST